MSESNATQQELTPGQIDYVVRWYDFMSKAKKEGLFREQLTRDLVAACLEIAHSTVMMMMHAYRADNDTKFEVRTSIIVVSISYQLYNVNL
ncbi:hypothetical protein F441_19634 [Phytophthora nicotianae CJ01A1]|uniref:Uncharacterized protein n=1 Tax=Phytophthora nicotianae CJ01A1 TaxID=1317063 RepID=W2VZ07_PHYNI|nr:hypothetical protein F441_19634 [Phytophthora nicotianae CJ01A1]